MDKHIIRENAGKTLAFIKHRRTSEMDFTRSQGCNRVQ